MNNQVTYNLAHLTCIKFSGKKEIKDYKWVEATPAKSFFFGLFKTPGKPAGFKEANSLSDVVYSLGRMSKDFIIEGEKIYERPSVSIYINNKRECVKSFETDGEAKTFEALVQDHFLNKTLLQLEY